MLGMFGIGQTELILATLCMLPFLAMVALLLFVVIRLYANPKLRPCPDCGKMVSKAAEFCPNCGRPFPPA